MKSIFVHTKIEQTSDNNLSIKPCIDIDRESYK